jgi:hypothetical protein
MSRPGTALKNFTDREDQQKRLIALVSLLSTDDKTGKLPILSYYGISGVGKSWLSKRFGEVLAGRHTDDFAGLADLKDTVPSVRLDFDVMQGSGGATPN